MKTIPSPFVLAVGADHANVEAGEAAIVEFLSGKTSADMVDVRHKDESLRRGFVIPLGETKLNADERIALAFRCAQSGWHAEFEWSWKPEVRLTPL